MSVYRIEYLEDVVKRDIPQLPAGMAKIIHRAIHARLAVDPAAYGKPLRHSLKGRWRLRVGDWRLVYLIDQARLAVIITAIRHRKDIYED